MSYPPYAGAGYAQPTYPPAFPSTGAQAAPYPGGGAIYPPGAPSYPGGSSPYPSGAPGYPSYAAPGSVYPPSAAPTYPPSSSPAYPPQSVSPVYPQTNQGYPAPGSSFPAGAGYPQTTPGYPPSGPYSSGPLPYGFTSSPASSYPTPLAPQASAQNYSAASLGGAPSYPGQLSSYQQIPVSTSPYSAAPSSGMGGYAAQQTYHGTIVPFPNFNVEMDAKILRNAMKGIGTDEKAIIEVIARRSNRQRQDIARTFKTMYGKDLIKELEGELSGDFKEVIMALFSPTTFYDAWSLNNAMRDLGTKEGVLIEILCSRTNAEIREIALCYRQHFGRNLENDIISDTSGHFKRLLVSACQGNRDENPTVNIDLARKEAQDLYQAGEKCWGTDESVFNMVLSKRHYNQLRATFEEYTRLTGRDILDSIRREFSGDVETGMKAIVMCARNRPQYFADKLQKSMKGFGTNDSALIRIIVSRSEYDLVQIKQCFSNTYSKSLAQVIHAETSGDYRRLLLALIGN